MIFYICPHQGNNEPAAAAPRNVEGIKDLHSMFMISCDSALHPILMCCTENQC